MKKNTMKNVFWGVMLILDLILNFWVVMNPERFGEWCRKLMNGMYPELDEELKNKNID
jgi:hypothetical protein